MRIVYRMDIIKLEDKQTLKNLFSIEGRSEIF